MLVWIVLAVLGLGVAVALYAVFVERRWYRLVRHRLDILPAGENHLTVLHLSDLHLTENDRSAATFLSRLPKADLTVVTGDAVGHPDAVEYVARTLRPVRGRVASLFVLGSNDVYAPRPLNWFRYLIPRHRRKPIVTRRGRPGDLVRLLERDGWVHLKNRKYEGRTNGVRMEIVGLDDSHIHRSDPRVALRTEPAAFGLAVIHSPDPAPELAALGYDLVVAGHTHGGQVRLPWIGALVTNCTIPTRLARGLSRVGPAVLHVSPGIGTSTYAPFRLFCRPEATVLELRPGPDQPAARMRS